MMSHRSISLLGFAFFAVVLSSACKGGPKAGDPCTTGKGACVDPKSMMACIGGVFAPIPCQGATGCVTTGDSSECDNSLASVGDACDEIGDYACSHDMKAALTCKANKFAVEGTCKGAGACTLKKDGLYCDNDVSDPGDPCHTVGDFACTADRKLALKCGADHTRVPLNTCKGAKGCRAHELPDQNKVEFVCDDAVADANDPCDEDGEAACTMDRKAILKCASGKFAPLTTCPGGCSFDATGDKFDCDPGLAAAAAASSAAAKKGTRKGK
jgi:hypothetical protein